MRTETTAALELEPFNRNNPSHTNMVKAAYYAWYGPTDAQQLLASKGIHIQVSQVSQQYYIFKGAHLDRADRSLNVDHYLNNIATI